MIPILDPTLVTIYYNRGFTYIAQGKKAEAIADFEKVITVTTQPELVRKLRKLIEVLRQ